MCFNLGINLKSTVFCSSLNVVPLVVLRNISPQLKRQARLTQPTFTSRACSNNSLKHSSPLLSSFRWKLRSHFYKETKFNFEIFSYFFTPPAAYICIDVTPANFDFKEIPWRIVSDHLITLQFDIKCIVIISWNYTIIFLVILKMLIQVSK